MYSQLYPDDGPFLEGFNHAIGGGVKGRDCIKILIKKGAFSPDK